MSHTDLRSIALSKKLKFLMKSQSFIVLTVEVMEYGIWKISTKHMDRREGLCKITIILDKCSVLFILYMGKNGSIWGGL